MESRHAHLNEGPAESTDPMRLLLFEWEVGHGVGSCSPEIDPAARRPPSVELRLRLWLEAPAHLPPPPVDERRPIDLLPLPLIFLLPGLPSEASISGMDLRTDTLLLVIFAIMLSSPSRESPPASPPAGG